MLVNFEREYFIAGSLLFPHAVSSDNRLITIHNLWVRTFFVGIEDKLNCQLKWTICQVSIPQSDERWISPVIISIVQSEQVTKIRKCLIRDLISIDTKFLDLYVTFSKENSYFDLALGARYLLFLHDDVQNQ